MKSYDVHCNYDFVMRVEAETAQQAKRIAEDSEAYRDGEMVSGPDVVAVYEVTDAKL